MNKKSYTYDIDDWEVLSNTTNSPIQSCSSPKTYIESIHIENIYNENWYDIFNNNISKLNISDNQNISDNKILHNQNLYEEEEKNLKEIIKNAKVSWNTHTKIKNKKYKRRFFKRKMS